jgi:hypothetical protein
MAVRLIDRVPTEEIRADADQIHLGRLLLTLVVGVFFLIGFMAGKASLGTRFAAAAVRRGWKEARGEPTGRPRGGG